MERTSVVGKMCIISLQFSSILQVGDNEEIRPRSNILAIQEQVAEFSDKEEGDFEDFGIFSREIPRLVLPNTVTKMTHNRSPFIRVRSINIIGVSTAAVVQTGSNRVIDAESRIKHIRQFNTGETGVMDMEEEV